MDRRGNRGRFIRKRKQPVHFNPLFSLKTAVQPRLRSGGLRNGKDQTVENTKAVPKVPSGERPDAGAQGQRATPAAFHFTFSQGPRA
jgi:hypothetical protein